MENKKITRKSEIIRFIITGLICALADFLTMQATLPLVKPLGGQAAMAISTTCGFVIGVFLNYILSTYWVFMGVEKKTRTKSLGFILAFVLLSAVALGLSIAVEAGCSAAFLNWWGVDISNQSISELFKFQFWGSIEFWLFFVAFCLKTLVGLIWNYFTRKYILYRNKNK